MYVVLVLTDSVETQLEEKFKILQLPYRACIPFSTGKKLQKIHEKNVGVMVQNKVAPFYGQGWVCGTY